MQIASTATMLDAVERALDRGERAATQVGQGLIVAASQAREKARDQMDHLERKLERQEDKVIAHQEKGPEWWEPFVGSKKHENTTKALEADVDYTHAELDSQSTVLSEAREEGREALEVMGRAIEGQTSTFDTMRALDRTLNEDHETVVGLLG